MPPSFHFLRLPLEVWVLVDFCKEKKLTINYPKPPKSRYSQGDLDAEKIDGTLITIHSCLSLSWCCIPGLWSLVETKLSLTKLITAPRQYSADFFLTLGATRILFKAKPSLQMLYSLQVCIYSTFKCLEIVHSQVFVYCFQIPCCDLNALVCVISGMVLLEERLLICHLS